MKMIQYTKKIDYNPRENVSVRSASTPTAWEATFICKRGIAPKETKNYAQADFAHVFFPLSHVPRQKVNTSRLMSCFCIALTTTTYCGFCKSYAHQRFIGFHILTTALL